MQQALRARTTAALEVAEARRQAPPQAAALSTQPPLVPVCGPQGMLYLHSCSPPVLHRDLKPSNVFMDAGGGCRIGDFGMSCTLGAAAAAGGAEAGLTGETGTYVYMAPEARARPLAVARAPLRPRRRRHPNPPSVRR